MVISTIWSVILALVLIMIFARKDLGIAIFLGAITLGVLTHADLSVVSKEVFFNPSRLIMALAVMMIPILGGIMDQGGLMMEFIENLKVSKKTSMMLIPMIFGLLPIAGGALMSAPIIDKIDDSFPKTKKTAINVWFRHVVIMIYPLAPELIVVAMIAGLDLYYLVSFLLIPFSIMILIGYLTLVRSLGEVADNNEIDDRASKKRDWRLLIHHLIPIIVAPIFDLLGRNIFATFLGKVPVEIFMLSGLIIAIFIAIRFSEQPIQEYKTIPKKMKIWRYPLLIFAMYFFLECFQMSGFPALIADLNLNLIMFIGLAFVLGLITGRVQLPMTIIIPIFLTQFALESMPLISFILIYWGMFLGYLITPIHPCVSYSVEYFKVPIAQVIKKLIIPVFFGLILIFLGSLLSALA